MADDITTSEELKKAILNKYLTTPIGRAKLAIASFGPTEVCMELVTNDHSLVAHADRLIVQLERIQSCMTGEEEYDKRKFSSLLEGLKILSAEIHHKIAIPKS